MTKEGQGYPCYQRDMMMMIEVLEVVSLFNGILSFVGYSIPKPSLLNCT